MSAARRASREHVLLACPPVFSYHLSIQAEMRDLGYDVTWWNDRGSERSAYKVALRLFPDTVATRSTAIFEERLERLDVSSITRVLIVKGEGMSEDFIRALRRAMPQARMSLYLWDSVDNVARATVIAPLFDEVATFDPVDAERLGWTYRPLFARRESIAMAEETDAFEYDWCFIGTLHSDRYPVVERLRRSDPSRRSYFFGFVPSRALVVARHLADWRLMKVSRHVSTRMMPATEVAAVCRASRAILDVEHPRQRGLTMRTIETLLSGRKLITTNHHIVDSDLFDRSRVHVISRQHPQVPPAFFEMPFAPVPEAIRLRYTLRRWIADLIGDADPIPAS